MYVLFRQIHSMVLILCSKYFLLQSYANQGPVFILMSNKLSFAPIAGQGDRYIVRERWEKQMDKERERKRREREKNKRTKVLCLYSCKQNFIRSESWTGRYIEIERDRRNRQTEKEKERKVKEPRFCVYTYVKQIIIRSDSEGKRY